MIVYETIPPLPFLEVVTTDEDWLSVKVSVRGDLFNLRFLERWTIEFVLLDEQENWWLD